MEILSNEPTAPPAEPTPMEQFIADWRSQVCPICQAPLDLQFRRPAMLWWCAMCRKWFNEKMERI